MILQEHQPETFIECCAMQLAIMLEPALLSPSAAPVRLLSSVMRRLVRQECCSLVAAVHRHPRPRSPSRGAKWGEVRAGCG